MDPLTPEALPSPPPPPCPTLPELAESVVCTAMAQNEDASEQQEQGTQQASATTSYENSLEQVPIYSRYTPAVRESRLAGIHAPPQPVNPRAETPRHGLLSGCSVFVGRSTVGDAPSEVPKPENADEDTFYYVDDVDDDSAVSNAAADLLEPTSRETS